MFLNVSEVAEMAQKTTKNLCLFLKQSCNSTSLAQTHDSLWSFNITLSIKSTLCKTMYIP